MKIRTTAQRPNVTLCETSTSRIFTHITDDNDWAIVSPYRSEYSEKENRERMTQLKQEVRQLGYGFIQFISRWVEDGISFDEQSLFIPKMDSKTAQRLGKKYNQSSVSTMQDDKCVEICTTPFETYNVGDVVRTFNLTGDKVMNIQDAEEIFAKRKGGPASKPIKSGKAFHLSEVLELEQPRVSCFGDKYSERVIYSNSLTENSNKYRRLKRSLFGDKTGKIKTFAIISPENPLGWENTDDEEFKQKYLQWLDNPKKYNETELHKLKANLVAQQIQKTGDTTLRYGGFSYAPLVGHYGNTEHSLIIFNLTPTDANTIAHNYGQESYFFGKVYDDHSDIAYYKTTNACKTYKLIEITRTVTDAEDANDFFSKFGCKFRINMAEFGDELPEIDNPTEFEQSFNENLTFMGRASHRRNSRTK